MGVTNYMTVNGKIRSEQRSGEAHSRDYVLDRLGSVIQIYQNGWPIADACYEPYGGIYTQWNMEGKTFTWLGGWGYRQTGVEWSSVYVRARHYSRGLSNWTSVDPLWPSEMAYGYVENRVMTGVDPSGRDMMTCAVLALHDRQVSDPCSPQRPMTMKQACIATFCTLASVKDLKSLIKSLIKSGRNLDKPKDIQKLYDKIKNSSDPITNAKDCCRTANGFKGGLESVRWGSLSETPQLISLLCNSVKAKGKEFCAFTTKTYDDCVSCCQPLGEYTGRGPCMRECIYYHVTLPEPQE